MADATASLRALIPTVADRPDASELPRSAPDLVEPAADERVTRLGRFILLGRIGEGGMGQVFSAYDPDLDRKVAIKLLHDFIDETGLGAARLKREAQAMAKLSHPNVVQIYETGEVNGRLFIAMELVEGTSLAADPAQRGPASPDQIEQRLQLYLQAAKGLMAAHRHGLIHRDFKGDNVLIGQDGRARVADFGLARVVGSPATVDVLPEGAHPQAQRSWEQLTRAGALQGTPGYMAPEQVRGAEADQRSDQFACCAALYESLYGQQAYPGKDFEAYTKRVLAGGPDAPPPSEVPLVVQDAILRGLSPDPAARFPSMRELVKALEAGLHGESESRRKRLARIRLGLTLSSYFVLLIALNALVVVLKHDANSLLRAAMVNASAAMMFLFVALRPPPEVRERARFRQALLFYALAMGQMALGRLVGLWLRLDANLYFPVEIVALATLFVVEGLRLRSRHWLSALPALIYAPFLPMFPHLRVVLLNAVYFFAACSSIYLHTRPVPPPSATDAEREE